MSAPKIDGYFYSVRVIQNYFGKHKQNKDQDCNCIFFRFWPPSLSMLTTILLKFLEF